MNVLVFNVGSTTLKFALLDTDSGVRRSEGIVDRIGQAGGDAKDHLSAARLVLDRYANQAVDAIGHRVVQGGTRFVEPTLVTPEVLRDLEPLDALAPLHNPPARSVIEAIVSRELSTPQVMVFDTAFFVASLPPKAYRYAVSDEVYQKHGVRRYGAHGTSHQFVIERTLEFLNQRALAGGQRIISLHLGGGASATASVAGTAIETSMGMTPLEGLVMATRTGDIDPSVPLHLMRTAGLSVDEVDQLLNKQSGLLGLCGEVDMRAILRRCEAGEAAALLAIDVYVHRMLKVIGGYYAVLGGLDGLVFTAGVGENAAAIRARVTAGLMHLGVAIDEAANETAAADGEVIDLTHRDAAVRTLVVPTNEELAIARQVASCTAFEQP